MSMVIDEAVRLHFLSLERAVKQIVKCQKRKDLQHAFHIITIVKEQETAGIFVRLLHILMIYTNQVASAIDIFSVNAQQFFQGLLLTVGGMEKKFVWRDPLIDIYSI